MKKLLFVLSATSMGGTSKALENLYNAHNPHEWDMDVFVLTHNEYREVSYRKAMLPKNRLASAFYCFFDRQQGLEKVYVLFVKILRRVCDLLHIDLERWVLGNVIKQLDIAQYDTIVDFTGTGYGTTRLVSMMDGKHRIGWIHGFGKSEAEERSKERYYAQFDSLVCVSQQTCNRCGELYPRLKDRMVAIHNIMDTDKVIRLSQEAIDDDRYVTDSFTILSVGRISAVKRFSHIPQIAAKLKERHLAFRWYIIGPTYENDEVERLESNITRFAVEDCVMWLGGKDNPYPYFRKADLFACTSLSEAGPIVSNEARVLDIPVISADFPAAFEFIQDGESGVIAPLEQFAESIEQLMTDKGHYQHIKDIVTSMRYPSAPIIQQIDQLL